MKERFKKITILAWHKDRERIISRLQDLGVIHVEMDSSFHNEGLSDLENKKDRVKKTIAMIREREERYPEPGDDLAPEGLSVSDVISQVHDLQQQIDGERQKKEALHKEHLKRLPWGEFDPEKLMKLVGFGLNVHFCVAGKKEFFKYDFSEVSGQIIHEGSGLVYFVVIAGEGEEVSLPFETVRIPYTHLRDIADQEEGVRENTMRLEQKIRSYESYLGLLQSEWERLAHEMDFIRANGSYQEYGHGTILSLKGWFPASMEERLLHYLQQETFTYVIANPSPDDRVPVLLKNRRYPRLFESITRIFELPAYSELDLTPFIAVFYPILFAYCLGDAGYGLVLLGAMVAGWFTFLKAMRSAAVLGIILGVFTTLMGIVKSGSVFGIPVTTVRSNPFMDYLAQLVVIPDDSSYTFNAFNVALMIGVLQILTGILLSIANKLKYEGFKMALPQVGKLLIVTGVIWIFLADMRDIEALAAYPLVRQLMMMGGIGLVLLFHDLSIPIFGRVASGILPLFFTFTGILGDVLSYIRLFALGVASSVLGLVVNQIGMQIMENGWWGIVVGVVFLLLGHSLNFIIAILGAFVHPLRLTFVEFYNNAQFRGGGIEYKPFRH